MASDDVGTQDPSPGLRRRVRSVGMVALVLSIAYAMTVISDPPVGVRDSTHAWIAVALAFAALTSAKRTRDAPFGTPGGHLVRAALWLGVLASSVWNVVLHADEDALLLVVGVLTALAALANAVIRVRLSRI